MDKSYFERDFKKRGGFYEYGLYGEPEVNVVDEVEGEFGGFVLVGHGEVTNGYCGKFFCFKGCLQIELHNKMVLSTSKALLGHKNFKGMVYVKIFFRSCGKPSCPVCYKYGWATRQAGDIVARLKHASKRFGLVEHIVCSVPVESYELSLEKLRFKAVKILKSRGVYGGCLIFHHSRLRCVKCKSRMSDAGGFKVCFVCGSKWFEHFWSPHFHVLGYLFGKFRYSRCRGCDKRNSLFCTESKCDGFDANSERLRRKDGWVVKVLGKRKTVGGTAWYQLNHSSMKKNSVRFHPYTWFGVCSYRKLKVSKEQRKDFCPICNEELERIVYYGDVPIPRTVEEYGFKKCFLSPLYAFDGSLNWGKRYR